MSSSIPLTFHATASPRAVLVLEEYWKIRGKPPECNRIECRTEIGSENWPQPVIGPLQPTIVRYYQHGFSVDRIRESALIQER